ncbi:DUF4097 family beta strand repeat-containing protein [Saccharopolyspora taberi]|uniref:DUF4097 family beta strand repeat-containing protein n=1 Tax=Saccharopolyspora taberi TaxID=60895 RepID=A0ABN3V9R9_9PSEU
MPIFDTPEPISATIDVVAGQVRIIAGDRADTAVDVRPSDPGSAADVRAAERIRVEYTDRLVVKATRQWRDHTFRSDVASVEVTIELPAGSRVQGDLALGEFRCEGRLGDCRFKTAVGDIRVEDAGELRLKTSSGKITVDRAEGHAEIVTGSGDVRIHELGSTAVVKNSNGDTRLGEVAGDLRMRTANGNISVDRAHASVGARTANGDIRIGEVARGSVELDATTGELEIGIRQGTAAWLDVNSGTGRVETHLDEAEGPEGAADTVRVRARSVTGDIIVHRS